MVVTLPINDNFNSTDGPFRLEISICVVDDGSYLTFHLRCCDFEDQGLGGVITLST